MEVKRVYNQAELDVALKAENTPDIWICGTGRFHIFGSAQVRAFGSAQVTASKFVAVTKHAKTVRVKGGVLITVPPIKSAKAWCEFHGLPVVRGVVTLYKAVDSEYRANHNGFPYQPGTIPVAPDWDGGEAECGGGLHFSPRPAAALRFNSNATRFMACPVRVRDIAVHYPATYPDKVKAPGCCAPIWECDIDGNRIDVNHSSPRKAVA